MGLLALELHEPVVQVRLSRRLILLNTTRRMTQPVALTHSPTHTSTSLDHGVYGQRSDSTDIHSLPPEMTGVDSAGFRTAASSISGGHRARAGTILGTVKQAIANKKHHISRHSSLKIGQHVLLGAVEDSTAPGAGTPESPGARPSSRSNRTQSSPWEFGSGGSGGTGSDGGEGRGTISEIIR